MCGAHARPTQSIAVPPELRKRADDKSVSFVNMRDEFMEKEPGTVKVELYTDKLHPNDKGFDVMTKVMQPVIEEMLK